MRNAGSTASALTVLSALGLLAGCGGAGGSQVSALPPAGEGAAIRTSWMSPDAKRRDLLYVSDLYDDHVNVYSYPQGKLEGVLTGFQAVHYECVDAAGNVFIANGDAKQVLEYAHGGTKPIKTYTEPGFTHGCAIDPTTGDLAVLHDPPTSGYGGFSIYTHAKGKPKEYVTPNVFRVYFIGYDGKGNLFVDGSAYHLMFEIAELPAGSQTPRAITLNQTINLPGAIAWDGKYLAVGDQVSIYGPSKIYQFSISGSTGTLKGTTSLSNSCDVLQFWLQGSRVITSDVCAPHALYFNYPAGGSSTKTISNSLHEPVGVTVSRAR
ncbi:MAG TPA: hypothetical protein VMT95_05010 [Candidatus Binatia bacterium]|nr:hypothetical protein [Candidatus Binatia bacterium]